MTDRKELEPRLVDRDKLWALFCDHYWDSFNKDRDLILCHVDAVLRMADDVPAHIGDMRALNEEDIAREIHRYVNVRELFEGAQELTGVEKAARAIALLRSHTGGE